MQVMDKHSLQMSHDYDDDDKKWPSIMVHCIQGLYVLLLLTMNSTYFSLHN